MAQSLDEKLAELAYEEDRAAAAHFVLGEHHLCPEGAPCRQDDDG